jgi:hypothetical protein
MNAPAPAPSAAVNAIVFAARAAISAVFVVSVLGPFGPLGASSPFAFLDPALALTLARTAPAAPARPSPPRVSAAPALAIIPDRDIDVSYRETCVPDAGEEGVVSVHVACDHGHWAVERTLGPAPGQGYPVHRRADGRPEPSP